MKTIVVMLEIPTKGTAKATLAKAKAATGAVQGTVMVIDATKGKKR